MQSLSEVSGSNLLRADTSQAVIECLYDSRVARKLKVLLDGGIFFEGPRWHDDRWWVSDIVDQVVLAVDPSGRSARALTVEHQPSGLGWLPDGSLLVVSMRDHRLLRQWPDGHVTEHADLTAFCGGWLNDMVVDSLGRAYVGDFGFDLFGGAERRSTVLVRVDPDGSARVAADDLMFPNGAVITADRMTLVVGETFRYRYTSFRIDEDGALIDRTTWADLERTDVRDRIAPDGCALDAEGHLWSADARSGRCFRIAPGGSVVDAIEPPAGLRYYACMLGGVDGRSFLGCATMSANEAVRDRLRSSVLVTTTVDVPHAGLP